MQWEPRQPGGACGVTSLRSAANTLALHSCGRAERPDPRAGGVHLRSLRVGGEEGPEIGRQSVPRRGPRRCQGQEPPQRYSGPGGPRHRPQAFLSALLRSLPWEA